MAEDINSIFDNGLSNRNTAALYRQLIDYIEKNNAKCYSQKDLVKTAISRLQSKPVVSDGVILHMPFFKRFFTAKRVGKILQKNYSDFIAEAAENVKFCIPEGTLLTKDIKLLIIAPGIQRVHALTLDNQIYPIIQSANHKLKVMANDISKLEIAFSDKAKAAISHHRNRFNALSDIRPVLAEISDIDLNTTKENTDAVLEVIKELPEDDERLILLKEMGPEIIDDISLIFTDLDLYWG